MTRQRINRAAAQRARRKRLRTSYYSMGAIAIGLAAWGALSLLAGSSGSSGTITVVGTDFSFSPELIEGVAGEIDLTLENHGPGGHDLVVLEQGVHIRALTEFDEATSLGKIEWTAPGESATERFTLGPGSYQVVCLIPGHLEAGMQAELVVSSAPES